MKISQHAKAMLRLAQGCRARMSLRERCEIIAMVADNTSEAMRLELAAHDWIAAANRCIRPGAELYKQRIERARKITIECYRRRDFVSHLLTILATSKEVRRDIGILDTLQWKEYEADAS